MMKRKRFLISLGLILVGVLLFSSVPALAGENPGRGKSLAEARKALEQQLISVPGFVGSAHSEEKGEITVFVENERAKGIAPQRFEGHPVRVEVTGRIQALSTQVAEPITDVSEGREGVVTPLVGGISLAAYVEKQSWAGTLSMVTYDDKILSNTHVIAMDSAANFLTPGTPIIQPGSYDGGILDNRVGTLEKYMPIKFGKRVGRSPNMRYPANYADAAISSIDGAVSASPGEQFDEDGNYTVSGMAEVNQGDVVRKSGRTTGVTTGEVVHTNASVLVEYAEGKVAISWAGF